MTAALLPALDAFLEATREVERQRILGRIERRLERAMMVAFAEHERRFLRMFRTLRWKWPQPMSEHGDTQQERTSRATHAALSGGSAISPAAPPPALREAIEPRDWEPLFTAAELATLRLYEQPLSATMEAAMSAGARAGIADIGLGLSFDLAHPEAVAYLQRAAIKVAGINETTREEVRRILIQGAEEGWSYDRTAKALQERWAAFRTPVPQQAIRSRAHMIAVTETGDAYVQGNLIVGRDLKRAGLPMEKRWLDTGDERTCPICQGNAAEGWIPLDAAFSSGHDGPTAHPSCRCDVQQRAALG